MLSFDVIIIGTGSAGKTVAEAARQAGKTVAIIDKQPFGGTCSQRGCDPKKVLVGASEIVARATQLMGKGIVGTPAIDWSALMAFKKTFTDSIPKNAEQKFGDQGIYRLHGVATFLSENTVRVGNNILVATHIVIAAGAKPRPLHIPGEELIIDSTAFLELAKLPGEIVMVGGGYIAFEFAHLAARVGANVTILHQGKHPLEGFDADVVNLLVKAITGIGIQIILEASVTAVTGKPGYLEVQYELNGEHRKTEAELVVHAAGRVADVDELNLEKAGVALGKKGVVVNEYLQSVTNPVVYACGDAADKGLPLTPVASYEGRIVAQNILKGNRHTVANKPVPATVFTVPPLASVGLTETQAIGQGYDVSVLFQETSGWYSSRRTNEPVTGFKTLVDKQTGLILGAHVLGAGSEEIINLFALAMNYQIAAKDLGDQLFAYPTHGSDLSYMLPD